MITIEMPLDAKSLRDIKELEKQMKKIGVSYDAAKEILQGVEDQVKKGMRSFRHPVTKGSVSSTIRRQPKGLMLSVDIEGEHEAALVKHLGL